jgi:hypothetical protein
MPSDLVLCGPERVSGHLHSQTWAGVWPSLPLMRAYSCKRVVSVLTIASSVRSVCCPVDPALVGLESPSASYFVGRD